MQFPVSLSLSLNACLHTQSGKQTMGHFTAEDRVLNRPATSSLI